MCLLENFRRDGMGKMPRFMLRITNVFYGVVRKRLAATKAHLFEIRFSVTWKYHTRRILRAACLKLASLIIPVKCKPPGLWANCFAWL